MSTCPDPDLYSALYDGEVPSPWKEKLEAHLAHCERCSGRFARYGMMGTALKAGFADAEQGAEWLEGSFDRLSARLATASRDGAVTPFALARARWANRSVRMSLPALAAMLIAAIVLPSTLVMVASRNRAEAMPALASISSIAPAGALQVSRNSPVYSPDPLPQSVAGQLLVSNQQLFTMVDYARQFSNDDSLFDNAQIIIIKLPDLTRFGGADDHFLPSGDSLQFVADFAK